MVDSRWAVASLGLLASATFALPALALTTFGSRADWESAVGLFDTEDFETTPVQGETCSALHLYDGTCLHEVVFDAPKLDIVLPVGSHGSHEILEIGFNGSRVFLSDLHGQILIAGISYNTIVFPDPIYAFAVDLANVYDGNDLCTYPVEAPNCDPVPFPLTIDFGGVSTALAAGTTFFGAISDSPVTEVTVRITDEFGYVVLPALDNISFAIVPEPGSALLLGVGLASLGARRRRCAWLS